MGNGGAIANFNFARVSRLVAEANRSEIHRRTGITLSHVSRVLAGHRTPSAGKLKALADCLGVTMDELHRYLSIVRAGVDGGGRGDGRAA